MSAQSKARPPHAQSAQRRAPKKLRNIGFFFALYYNRKMTKKALAALCALALCQAEAGARKNGFDLEGALVAAEDIHRGGPPRDGIPALDSPRFDSAEETFLRPDDWVIGVAVAGEARAYPIRILNWHEIVNDQIGALPIAVTFCPLCGSGVVFDAQRDSGRATFGVSGLLFNNDVLLYDRETESLFSQLSRQAISGALRGAVLRVVPSEYARWRDWRARHPHSVVLSPRTGHGRDYDRDPYAGYDKIARLFFPLAADAQAAAQAADDSLHPKESVLGIEAGGAAKAYPFSTLRENGEESFVDSVGGVALTLRWNAEDESARVESAPGNVVATRAFWFAWRAFHPETEIFTAR